MEIKRTWTWKNIADNECNYGVCLTWLLCCGWFHQVHNLLLYLRHSTTLKKRVREWWRNAHYTHTHNYPILNERGIALCIDFQDTKSSSFLFLYTSTHDLFLVSILQQNELLQSQKMVRHITTWIVHFIWIQKDRRQ